MLNRNTQKLQTSSNCILKFNTQIGSSNSIFKRHLPVVFSNWTHRSTNSALILPARIMNIKCYHHRAIIGLSLLIIPSGGFKWKLSAVWIAHWSFIKAKVKVQQMKVALHRCLSNVLNCRFHAFGLMLFGDFQVFFEKICKNSAVTFGKLNRVDANGSYM